MMACCPTVDYVDRKTILRSSAQDMLYPEPFSLLLLSLVETKHDGRICDSKGMISYDVPVSFLQCCRNKTMHPRPIDLTTAASTSLASDTVMKLMLITLYLIDRSSNDDFHIVFFKESTTLPIDPLQDVLKLNGPGI